MDNKIKVTLLKSTVACLPVQRATVKALGLKKIGQSKEFTDCAAVQGQIKVVSHLVKVEKA